MKRTGTKRRLKANAKRRPQAKRPKGVTNDTAKGKSDERSARHVPGLAPPHHGRPVRGCSCWLCVEHRRLNRQAARDHALAALHDDGVGGSVRTGQNATDALRAALGAT